MSSSIQDIYELAKKQYVKLNEDEALEIMSVRDGLIFLYDVGITKVIDMRKHFVDVDIKTDVVELVEADDETNVTQGILIYLKHFNYAVTDNAFTDNDDERYVSKIQIGVHKQDSDVPLMTILMQKKRDNNV